jgi:signal transduction histidine kinase
MDMHHSVPAAIAFFALGAVFLGSVLLLLFNPRSAAVRWYVAFQVGLMAWLALQGIGFAFDALDRVRVLHHVAVHMLPALFLAFVLVEDEHRPARDAVAALLVGVMLVPFTLGLVPGVPAGVAAATWHTVGWGTGTIGHMRSSRRRRSTAASEPARRRLETAVSTMLFTVAPVVLVGFLAFGAALFYYAMPLLVVGVQILVFVGVAHLRFYDIEVKTARRGELVTRAAEAERMALVGELSASLAHEIRNPLTGVRSLAQRLAEETVDEPRRKRYAGVILEETARVERLVANLLAVAKRAPSRPAGEVTTPLGSLLEDLTLLLAGRAASAGVTLAVSPTRSIVAAQREPLAQILLNVLLNAIQHSPPSGVVAITASEVDGGVEIRVRDRGPGIPPADLERAWEPFHSTSGGTGLGLSIVRRVAREEGWTVAIESPVDGGLEFRMLLPADRTAYEADPGRPLLVGTER